jgi:hypothetical protein
MTAGLQIRGSTFFSPLQDIQRQTALFSNFLLKPFPRSATCTRIVGSVEIRTERVPECSGIVGSKYTLD